MYMTEKEIRYFLIKQIASVLAYNNNFIGEKAKHMEYINTRPLTFMVHRIVNSSRLEHIFNQINESCHLDFKFQCPQNVLSTAKRVNERQVHEKKYKPTLQKNKNLNWVFGEYKIFIWTIVYKCLINGLELEQLTMEIVKDIQNIFKSKSLTFIHYEIKLLISQKYNDIFDTWEQTQLDMFTQIMHQHEKKSRLNWRSISFDLFLQSDGKYFRNINHCREKWFNHLNPIVKKGPWTMEEDIQIFNLIRQYGLRWSKISNSMGKIRTEHMIKNRVNKYFKLWKINSESGFDIIDEFFRQKIEKPYYNQLKNSSKQLTQQINQNQERNHNQKVKIQNINQSNFHHFSPNQRQEDKNKQIPSKTNQDIFNLKMIKPEIRVKNPQNEIQIRIKIQEASEAKSILEKDIKCLEESKQNQAYQKGFYYPFFNIYYPSPFNLYLH